MNRESEVSDKQAAFGGKNVVLYIVLREPVEEGLAFFAAVGDVIGEDQAIISKQSVFDQELELIQVLILLRIEEHQVVRGLQVRDGEGCVSCKDLDRGAAFDHPGLRGFGYGWVEFQGVDLGVAADESGGEVQG